jgi:hypothetical protein
MNDNTDNEIAHRRSKREQGKKETKGKESMQTRTKGVKMRDIAGRQTSCRRYREKKKGRHRPDLMQGRDGLGWRK